MSVLNNPNKRHVSFDKVTSPIFNFLTSFSLTQNDVNILGFSSNLFSYGRRVQLSVNDNSLISPSGSLFRLIRGDETGLTTNNVVGNTRSSFFMSTNGTCYIPTSFNDFPFIHDYYYRNQHNRSYGNLIMNSHRFFLHSGTDFFGTTPMAIEFNRNTLSLNNLYKTLTSNNISLNDGSSTSNIPYTSTDFEIGDMVRVTVSNVNIVVTDSTAPTPVTLTSTSDLFVYQVSPDLILSASQSSLNQVVFNNNSGSSQNFTVTVTMENKIQRVVFNRNSFGSGTTSANDTNGSRYLTEFIGNVFSTRTAIPSLIINRMFLHGTDFYPLTWSKVSVTDYETSDTKSFLYRKLKMDFIRNSDVSKFHLYMPNSLFVSRIINSTNGIIDKLISNRITNNFHLNEVPRLDRSSLTSYEYSGNKSFFIDYDGLNESGYFLRTITPFDTTLSLLSNTDSLGSFTRYLKYEYNFNSSNLSPTQKVNKVYTSSTPQTSNSMSLSAGSNRNSIEYTSVPFQLGDIVKIQSISSANITSTVSDFNQQLYVVSISPNLMISSTNDINNPVLFENTSNGSVNFTVNMIVVSQIEPTAVNLNKFAGFSIRNTLNSSVPQTRMSFNGNFTLRGTNTDGIANINDFGFDAISYTDVFNARIDGSNSYINFSSNIKHGFGVSDIFTSPTNYFTINLPNYTSGDNITDSIVTTANRTSSTFYDYIPVYSFKSTGTSTYSLAVSHPYDSNVNNIGFVFGLFDVTNIYSSSKLKIFQSYRHNASADIPRNVNIGDNNNKGIVSFFRAIDDRGRATSETSIGLQGLLYLDNSPQTLSNITSPPSSGVFIGSIDSTIYVRNSSGFTVAI